MNNGKVSDFKEQICVLRETIRRLEKEICNKDAEIQRLRKNEKEDDLNNGR